MVKTRPYEEYGRKLLGYLFLLYTLSILTSRKVNGYMQVQVLSGGQPRKEFSMLKDNRGEFVLWTAIEWIVWILIIGIFIFLVACIYMPGLYPDVFRAIGISSNIALALMMCSIPVLVIGAIVNSTRCSHRNY